MCVTQTHKHRHRHRQRQRYRHRDTHVYIHTHTNYTTPTHPTHSTQSNPPTHPPPSHPCTRTHLVSRNSKFGACTDQTSVKETYYKGKIDLLLRTLESLPGGADNSSVAYFPAVVATFANVCTSTLCVCVCVCVCVFDLVCACRGRALFVSHALLVSHTSTRTCADKARIRDEGEIPAPNARYVHQQLRVCEGLGV